EVVDSLEDLQQYVLAGFLGVGPVQQHGTATAQHCGADFAQQFVQRRPVPARGQARQMIQVIRRSFLFPDTSGHDAPPVARWSWAMIGPCPSPDRSVDMPYGDCWAPVESRRCGLPTTTVSKITSLLRCSPRTGPSGSTSVSDSNARRGCCGARSRVM